MLWKDLIAEFSTTPGVNYRKLRNIKENDERSAFENGSVPWRKKQRCPRNNAPLYRKDVRGPNYGRAEGRGSRVTLSRKVAVEEDL